jgi:diaminopimelate epimerase
MNFWKAHAYGNDFLYVEQESVAGIRVDALAVEMCERHTGIGADGLIVFARTADGATMQLFNADGGRAEVSGNGVRGLAALLIQHDPRDGLQVAIHTDGGLKTLTRVSRGADGQVFRAAMGVPRDIGQESLSAAGETVTLVVLNIGNPQAIVLGPLPDDERFMRLGQSLERHPRFPNRTNVEFVQVEAPDRLRIRIWERGAGPTQSSGTGSCASLVAAASFGGASRDAEVIAPGGAQRVEWREDGVYLTGAAVIVCEGRWLLPLPR